MAADDLVLAIVVNFNGGGRLLETLQGLAANDYRQLEIEVVDAASTDGSVEAAQSRFSGFRCRRLTENPGYGAAANRAMNLRPDTEAVPTYFLVANNDIQPAPDMVSRLIAEARRRGPSVIGPQVLKSGVPQRLEAAWGHVTWNHVAARFIGKDADPDHPAWLRTREVELLLGTVLLIHRDVLQSVGGFDPQFFMYHEEVDFLYRVRRAGFPVVYCPQARVIHLGGHGSRGNPLFKIYWTRRNAVLMLRKHRRGWVDRARWALSLAGSLAWNAVTIRPRRLTPILRGARDGWTTDVESGEDFSRSRPE